VKKIFLILLTIILISSITNAQAASLAWDIVAPDIATARSYTYAAYLGSATVPTILSPVTCTGTTSPFTCSTPNYTPFVGQTITLTAKNGIGESPKSVPFPLFLPATPVNVRLQ